MKNRVLQDAKNLLTASCAFKGKLLKFPANFANLRYSNKENSIHHQIILEHAVKAESVIPGGSKKLIENLFNSSLEVKSNFLFRQPKKKEILEILKSLGYEDSVFNSCLVASHLAGAGGKILISSTAADSIVIDVRAGSQFNVINPLEDFHCNESKIILIDGFVESVSEIHHLLTELAESKEEAIILARAFSNEVLNTLAINLKRVAVKLHPLIVKFDENGINTLKDMSIVSGSQIVSSDLGSLISSIKLSELPIIKKCYCLSNKFYIEQDRSVEIDKHVQFLLEKLKEEKEEMKTKLISSRLECLSSRQVNIKIPYNMFSANIRQSFDSCLRHILNLSKNGICEEEDNFKLATIYNLIKSCEASLEAILI